MLRYKETNWKDKKGFKTHKYGIRINAINASKTRTEQQTKLEKISLVVFLNKEQKRLFLNICRRLKRIDKDFYQNKNLHVTIFGFGPLKKQDYQLIRKKIQEFTRRKRNFNLTINFDTIRPGTMYSKNKTLRPFPYISNGTVIAIGDVIKNEDFFNFSNQLTTFLLRDIQVKSILGPNFRKKFPVVWCTLGYFHKPEQFQIGSELLKIFIQCANLKDNYCSFPISEISLVKSKYKNLRYPKLIQGYRI